MKNKIIGLFSVVILIASIFMTPKVEAFDPGGIFVHCSYEEAVCATVSGFEDGNGVYFGAFEGIEFY